MSITLWKPEPDVVLHQALGKLAEECAELSQALARCLIQGYREEEPATQKLNRTQLMEEVADVKAAMRWLFDVIDEPFKGESSRERRKFAGFKCWQAMLEADLETRRPPQTPDKPSPGNRALTGETARGESCDLPPPQNNVESRSSAVGCVLHSKHDHENRCGETSCGASEISGHVDENCQHQSIEKPLPNLPHATSATLPEPIPAYVRDFLGKMQGVCMGVAMSGDDHPDPDGALLELFNEAQAILFPAATAMEGSDNG